MGSMVATVASVRQVGVHVAARRVHACVLLVCVRVQERVMRKTRSRHGELPAWIALERVLGARRNVRIVARWARGLRQCASWAWPWHRVCVLERL